MSRMVKCNNCMSAFYEEYIVTDTDSDREYCPICHRGGCLMDIDAGGVFMSEKQHWAEMEAFRVRLVKNVFMRLIEKARAAQASGYDGLGPEDLRDSVREYGFELKEGDDG